MPFGDYPDDDELEEIRRRREPPRRHQFLDDDDTDVDDWAEADRQAAQEMLADAIISLDENGNPVTRRDLDNGTWVLDMETGALSRPPVRPLFDRAEEIRREIAEGRAIQIQAEPVRPRMHDELWSALINPALGEPLISAEAAAQPMLPIPPICQRELIVDPPSVHVGWMRQVDELREAEGMAGLHGPYLHSPVGSNQYWVQPGSIVVVAAVPPNHGVARREEIRENNYVQHDLQAYVFLPEGIWYAIPHAGMRQRSGWHDAMRQRLRPWVRLSRGGRVIQACTEMIAELDRTLDMDRSILSEADFDEAFSAREHLHNIVEQVIARTPVTTLQPWQRSGIADSYEAWLHMTAENYQTNIDRVDEVVRAMLGVQPTNESRPERPITPRPRVVIENRQKRNIRINRSRE